MKPRRKLSSKKIPVLYCILVPMMILVLLEIMVLLWSTFGQGVIDQLDQNAKDILNEKVVNRSSYLENEMNNTWSNLEYTVEEINYKVKQLEEAGTIDLLTIDESSQNCLPLLEAISPDLITLMRSHRVTGAYFIANTSDLQYGMEQQVYKNKPGLYFRDMDPDSNASYENADLLIERAPKSIVQELEISTDSSWSNQFEFAKRNVPYYSWFYEPYQAAIRYPEIESFTDLGYWGPSYCLDDNAEEAITYSVPLKLEDGRVYGVLGIDITLSYLKALLPYKELSEHSQGSYLLAIEKTEGVFEHILISGTSYAQKAGDKTETVFDDDELYSKVEYLSLYNSNTPFSNQKWALIGIEETDRLLLFSRGITEKLAMSIVLTLAIGIGGSFLISFLFSRSIGQLANDMKKKDANQMIELNRTGIKEIDQMAGAVEELSEKVIDSATKFSQIMKMASVELAGFEMDERNRTLFITDHFFELLGIENETQVPITYELFVKKMQEFKASHIAIDKGMDEAVYKIQEKSGNRFVSIKFASRTPFHYGLAEDVTRVIMEKQWLEYERDHDLLTGLMNRRAFHRNMIQLFKEGSEKLKIAALVMLDLDNLKYVNDTYGHDLGDQYIIKAAECFRTQAPIRTIMARISGDEFYLFFYGYDTAEEIQGILTQLKREVDKTMLILPDKQEIRVRMSGGIARYPEDSERYEELLRYSDFAMYKVKHSGKGEIGYFQVSEYKNEEWFVQKKAKFTELIENQEVEYYFQPIIDAVTGEVFAYEALMRSRYEDFEGPDSILELAKRESCLNQIEELTWMKGLERFTSYIKRGVIQDTCKVFVNSISDQCMAPEKIEKIEQCFGEFLHLVVLELTEESKISQEMFEVKSAYIRKWNAQIALDDFGSGYNGNQTLLNCAPDYIKIDLSLIRNIDSDKDRRAIVSSVTEYAHERNMKIIAEGIETWEEAATVSELKVDYMQGFCFARPEQIPPLIPRGVTERIKKLYKNM